MGFGSAYVSVPFKMPSAVQVSNPIGVLQSQNLSLDIVLPPRNQILLDQLVRDVYNPNSSRYLHFLSPEEFLASYGPDPLESNMLVSYLLSNGLRAFVDPSNQFLIRATGGTAEIDSAFRVNLQAYLYQGRTFFAPNKTPSLPLAFSNVREIIGLENFAMGSPRNVNGIPEIGSSNSHPAPSAVPLYRTLGRVPSAPSAGNFLYYSPTEIKEAYNDSALTNAGYDGSGVTIAIVDAYGDPYIQQELDNYSAQFGVPSATVNVICVDGPCNYTQGISQGWNTEIALDVEWAHSIAPGAKINLYIGSNSSQPLFDAVERAVSDGTNSIISMSWGSPENTIGESSTTNPTLGQSYPWLDQVFEQAAAEGITAFASSGDWGAYDQGQNQSSPFGGAIYPATDPFVTAVGGTSLYMNTTGGYMQYPFVNATGTYGTETAWSWNNAYQWGTGGGYSTLFGIPDWQKGFGIPASTNFRSVPDVAWDADVQTGVIVGIYDQNSQSVLYYIVGGTSVGSPSWAGSLALLEQKAGTRLGFLNPRLYSILGSSNYSRAFHDVTVGNNNPLTANPGWDPLTGIGSPNMGVLSGLLLPSQGDISVAASNSLTNQPTMSYAYGSSVQLTAKVVLPPPIQNSPPSSVSVQANITSASGTAIASDIPMSYNTATQSYQGNYSIRPSDPDGMWSATIRAQGGAMYGLGFTSFPVGGGVTLFEPFYNVNNATFNSHNFEIGSKIQITAQVTPPSGTCCVSQGSYSAVFYLRQLGGKVEGTTALSYDMASKNWAGTFTVPASADQGPWVLSINGSDSNGNKASTYQWMYVGLNLATTTDSPNYLLGDPVTILASPEYRNHTLVVSGAFSATLTQGKVTVATLPLTYNTLYKEWTATYESKKSDPAGYYNVSVSGRDNYGNLGFSNTIIRVAPYRLNLVANLASTEISVVGGSESFVNAKVTYPDGSLLASGSVVAYLYLDLGHGVTSSVPLGELRMTYQSASQSFVGLNVLSSNGVFGQSVGKYDVIIQAFDAYGNYGNATTSFFVTGIKHSPISITSDADFTPANGVFNGSGTVSAPYIIAGWNTSSISITGTGITSSYEIINNWIEGSSGDGATINTPSAARMALAFDYAVSNAGNGFNISNTNGVVLNDLEASSNRGNGIVLNNDQSGSTGLIGINSATDNTGAGILIQNSRQVRVEGNALVANGGGGIVVLNSYNATVGLNQVISSPIGISVSGNSYGGAVVADNIIFNDTRGIEIDGGAQQISSGASYASFALVGGNIELNNSLAFLAINHAAVRLENNTIGYNINGVSFQNSFPVILDNALALNKETGINISGYASSAQRCEVRFNETQTTLSFDSCITQNTLDSNGRANTSAISISNLNGSFIYLNNVTNNFGNGLGLDNVSNSGIFSNLIVNNSADGIYALNPTADNISYNAIGLDDNGIMINSGSRISLGQNNASLNRFTGILISDSRSNLIENNTVLSNAYGCTMSLNCTRSAGIKLSGSSGNTVMLNNVENNSSPQPQTGFGVLFDLGSSNNTLTKNNITNNFAGLGFLESHRNNATANTLKGNNYGIYFLNGARNSYLGNAFAQNKQDFYPSLPVVRFASPSNGITTNGGVNITWNITGQALSNETLSIDGKEVQSSDNISGSSSYSSSFFWNTSSLTDATHRIVLTAFNSGGLSSNATLLVTTDNFAINNHAVIVKLVAPGGFPIMNDGVLLSNSTLHTTGSTNSSGQVVFHRLRVGVYNVSAVVNGTSYDSSVNVTGNASLVVLAPPTLSTTAYASYAVNHSLVPLTLLGNISAPQLSNITLSKGSSGTYVLTFQISGNDGTFGNATLLVSNSLVPSGFAPKVYIDGKPVNGSNLVPVHDSSGYHIPLALHFSLHSIEIQFVPQIGFFQTYLIPIVVVIVVVVIVAAFLAMRRRKSTRTGQVFS